MYSTSPGRSTSYPYPLTLTVLRVYATGDAAPQKAAGGGLPDTLLRVGSSEIFPNEYPGQNYKFNWCLNFDGVTPIKKAAFRITKPLDLKIAGLPTGGTAPVKVKAAAASKMPEAGSDALDFDAFDEASNQIKDMLSLSDKLLCPEGDMPGTRVGVRVITNSPTLAPQMLGYLDRAPRGDPVAMPITVYCLETQDIDFVGYALEEVEDPETGDPKSVAAVVVASKKIDAKVVAAGMELSLKGLEADEAERAAKKAAEEKTAADEASK